MIAFATVNFAEPAGCDALAKLSPGDRTLVAEALSVPLTHIAHEMYARASAERELFEEGPDLAPAITDWYQPMPGAKRPPRAARRFLLNPEEERHVFLRYNYARWRAAAAVADFRAQASAACARAIALWYGRVKETRDLIARANLALVLAMAKRIGGRLVEFDELICEGNVALLRAIDAFDVGRGFKFSSYACRAILKAFFRMLAQARRHRAAFPCALDALLESSDYTQQRLAEDQRDTLATLRRMLLENRARLTGMERTVILNRFALHGAPAPAMTLDEVGQVVGVTRERVRQIQNKALAKLRAAFERTTRRGQAALPPPARKD